MKANTALKCGIESGSETEMNAPNPREFIQLFVENERRIYAYILTLLGNSADAEDVLQETSLILWDKFSEFKQGTDFIAWSFKTAYFTAQNFRRKKGRSKVTFNNDLFDTIAEESTSMVEELDSRHQALADCINELPQNGQQLLKLRYEQDATVETTAAASGKTVQAVYKALSRLRNTLFECVNRKISLEANHGSH